jgi:hypothetical protein
MTIKDLLGLGPGIYEVKTKCSNCNTKQLTRIKKGNKASEVIERGKCERCGCMTLTLD